MPRNNNNNNQVQRFNDDFQRIQQGSYYTDSQVTTGNLATGDQRVVRRSTQ